MNVLDKSIKSSILAYKENKFIDSYLTNGNKLDIRLSALVGKKKFPGKEQE